MLDHLQEVGLNYQLQNSVHSLLFSRGLLSDKAGAEIQQRCQSLSEESVLEDERHLEDSGDALGSLSKVILILTAKLPTGLIQGYLAS